MTVAQSSLLSQPLNYLWQLRPYSYVDLLLLMAWLNADTRQIAGVTALWFGFLIHLEWRHRDAGRAKWHWAVWIVLWVAGAYLIADLSVGAFWALGAMYAMKKDIALIAPVAWLINGAMKAALVATLPLTTSRTLLEVALVMAARNLTGDVRDAGKDFGEGVRSLPVVLGYRRNTRVVYPVCLAATSTTWSIQGGLPWWYLIAALMIAAATYRLTSR
jgi:hypothetical protein